MLLANHVAGKTPHSSRPDRQLQSPLSRFPAGLLPCLLDAFRHVRLLHWESDVHRSRFEAVLILQLSFG